MICNTFEIECKYKDVKNPYIYSTSGLLEQLTLWIDACDYKSISQFILNEKKKNDIRFSNEYIYSYAINAFELIGLKVAKKRLLKEFKSSDQSDIVLLVKNRQLLYANALNAWLHSLEFYRDFAIPAYNQATRGTGQPIIPDTDIVAIADALLDPQARNHTQYLEALSFRAFRLFTIEMCIRAHTIEVRFVTSTQQIGVLAYVDDINLIPDNILNIFIR